MVKDVLEGPTALARQGELEVRFECIRRIRIKSTLGNLSTAEFLDDHGGGSAETETALFAALLEIAKLEKALGRHNAV